MCTACGRWIGSTGRCTRCRLTRALPTHLGVPLLLLGLAVGLTAALPTAVEAVNTCNTFAAIDYTAGPNFGLQGDTYRVKLSLFTGSITGGTKVNVTRVRFNLDCTDATAGTLNCTDLGAIISYSGDATITTDCPTGWTTANAANSTSPNQVVLTAGTPFDIPANTGTPAVPFCELEFDVKIANLPSPAQAAVAQTAGFDQTQSDGSCDNTPTPLKATGTQSGSINLCPTCTDEECNTVTCDQSAGTCTVLTPSNEGNACTGAAGTPNSCEREVCRTGTCVIETNPAQVGQACTFGTPVTNAECQQKLCAADGTCPVSNTNEGGTCDNASPAADTCQKEICQSGVCNAVADASKDSNACADTGNNCFIAGCQGGLCVQEHTPAGAGSSQCASTFTGAANGCTVLQLGSPPGKTFKVDITGPLGGPISPSGGGIVGDVCIGPDSKLSITGSEAINGDILLASGATFHHSNSGHLGNVLSNQNLAPEIQGCQAAAAAEQVPPETCDLTFGTLSGTQTINHAGPDATTVVCVTNVNVGNGQIITLNGGATDKFVFVVTGDFKINGGKIKVAGGLTTGNVLYNVIGTGEQVAFTGGGGGGTCCKAEIDGTLIALQRNIALSPGLVNGEICGGQNISIVSGSSVQCAPCVP